MDKIDRMYKLKSFLMELYKPCIGTGNNLQGDEYITTFQYNENFKKTDFYKNIDDLVTFGIRKNNLYCNTYFNLATTDGRARATENIKKAYCIALDFDAKDLKENCNIEYIQAKFKEIGLYYNAIVSSGNGFHYYIFIDPTEDINLVVEVTKKIASLLGADTKATLPTQILRLPYTYNVKEESNKKLVKLVYLDDKSKRKNINQLAKRFLLKASVSDSKNIEYTINSTNIPNCIANLLQNGSQEGNRNTDLQKIVVSLRLMNKSLETVLNVTNEWNNKNSKKLNQNELEYQTKYIYENVKYVDLGCKECKNKDNCWNRTVSQFEFPIEHKVLQMAETTTKYLKKNTRKGVKNMNGNQLLVYSILKCHSDGLYKDEIVKEMTYKDKKLKKTTVALSDKTLRNTLQELEENKFITVETVGKKKLYRVKETRNKVELTYNISYAAAYECVKNNITTEELRLYNYMRYLHNKEQRENSKALKGNILQINQSDLGKTFGVTQQRISKMIESLLNEKLLSILYREQSKNNSFEYYVYRLNY